MKKKCVELIYFRCGKAAWNVPECSARLFCSSCFRCSKTFRRMPGAPVSAASFSYHCRRKNGGGGGGGVRAGDTSDPGGQIANLIPPRQFRNSHATANLQRTWAKFRNFSKRGLSLGLNFLIELATFSRRNVIFPKKTQKWEEKFDLHDTMGTELIANCNGCQFSNPRRPQLETNNFPLLFLLFQQPEPEKEKEREREIIVEKFHPNLKSSRRVWNVSGRVPASDSTGSIHFVSI